MVITHCSVLVFVAQISGVGRQGPDIKASHFHWARRVNLFHSQCERKSVIKSFRLDSNSQ